MKIEVVSVDLLDQRVDAVVTAWNRNIIPWWLLLPRGVWGAIKHRAGVQPFREVARYGPIALSDAVLTSARQAAVPGENPCGRHQWVLAGFGVLDTGVRSKCGGDGGERGF